jgi:hypothetical protein
VEYATHLIFLYVKSMPRKLCKYMSITMMLNIKNDEKKSGSFVLDLLSHFR